MAYVVMQAAGIDSSGYSLGYVTTWQGGSDGARKSLKASATRIAKAARTIIDTAGVAAEELETQAA